MQSVTLPNKYPLVSCICPTYDRPRVLEESIQCFLDQTYPNKELIILVDNPNCEFILDCHSDQVRLVTVPERFSDLGTKYDYFKQLVKGDYVCIWEDDDLFGFNRIEDSIRYFNPNCDVIKSHMALMSTDNQDYCVTSNLFHSQSCFTRAYFDRTPFFNGESVGVDVEYESKARKHFHSPDPLFWYIYRWGNCHHLSGRPNAATAWADSENKTLKGYVVIKPQYHKPYWKEIYEFYQATNHPNKEKWLELYQDHI